MHSICCLAPGNLARRLGRGKADGKANLRRLAMGCFAGCLERSAAIDKAARLKYPNHVLALSLEKC